MGFIRSSFVVFFSLLLLISFLFLNSFFILSSSLNYNNIKDGLYPIAKDLSGTGAGNVIPKDILSQFNLSQSAVDASKVVTNYCKNNTDYNFTYNGYKINIPCQTINASNPEALINKTLEDIVHDMYYTQYNCSFLDCFSTIHPPLFLISEQARNYLTGKFYLSLIISIILIALIFLFVKKKPNAFIIVGSLLILSAIPLLKFGDLLYSISGNFSSLIKLFLGSTNLAFWLSLILGLILVSLGISLRIWGPSPEKEKSSKKEENKTEKKQQK